MITALLSILFFTSCDLKELEDERNFITISTSIDRLTRSSKTFFSKGDVISVYAYESSDNNRVAIENSINVYNGAQWEATPAMEWKNSLKNYDFLAIYPTHAITNPTVTDFTLEKEVAKNDLLVATNKNVLFKNAENVELIFEHIMSKVTVNLSFSSSLEPVPTIEKVVLSAKNSAQINFFTKEVTAKGNSTEIELEKGEGNQYVCIAIPQTIPSATQMILIYIQGDTTPYVFTTTSNIDLEAGKERTFSLTVENDNPAKLKNNLPTL